MKGRIHYFNDVQKCSCGEEHELEFGEGKICKCGLALSLNNRDKNGNGEFSIHEIPDCVDNEYVENIVCPKCGNENTDSWECEDEGEDVCSICGTEFTWSAFIERLFSTEIKAVKK